MTSGRRQGTHDPFSPAILGRIARAIAQAADTAHGGFGTGQKFPHPEVLDFALLWAERTGDPTFRELAQRTLEEMARGELLDPVEGGFFRYCATRDWRQPCTEKLLETQAGLLRNYLEGWQLFGRDEFRKVAQKTLSYVEHALRDPRSGGWFAGQEADDGYYALPQRLRADRKPPRVEPVLATRPLAATISAFLKAGAVLGDDTATRRALEATGALVEMLMTRGRGVYHSCTSDGTRQMLGLVGDHVFALRALLHVVQFTGRNEQLARVEELIGALKEKESARFGGFFDVRDDAPHQAQARRRHAALLENGLLAEALVRASGLLARPEWMELAERTLRAFAEDWPLYGYTTAEYGRALELFFHPPQCIFVVGPAADPRSARLLEVARRTFAPSKLVLALDPALDAPLLARHGFPAEAVPAARVCIAGREHARVEDPEALAVAMAAAEAARPRVTAP